MKYDNKEIVHIKKGNIEYLEFKILNKYNVKNAVTLRHGGVSQNICKSFNFGTAGGNDTKENVLKNFEILKENTKFCNFYKGKQAHTDKVIVLNNKNKDNYKIEKFNEENVDGYITNEKNIAEVIITADCSPIIIFDPEKRVVANVHAGWKRSYK